MANIERKLGDKDHYNSVSLKYDDIQELRSEYRRFRNEARKRIKKLQDAGYGDSRLLEHKEYLEESPKTLTKKQLVDYLIETDSFLSSSLSTVLGQELQQAKAVQKMQDLGYTEITKDTLREFGDFMEQSRQKLTDKTYGSDLVRDLYQMAKEKNISLANVEKDFEWYLANINKIDELPLNADRKRPYTKKGLEEIFVKKKKSASKKIKKMRRAK